MRDKEESWAELRQIVIEKSRLDFKNKLNLEYSKKMNVIFQRYENFEFPVGK